jgi:hypothetical protein
MSRDKAYISSCCLQNPGLKWHLPFQIFHSLSVVTALGCGRCHVQIQAINTTRLSNMCKYQYLLSPTPTDDSTSLNLHCNHGCFTKDDRPEPTNGNRNEYVPLLFPTVGCSYRFEDVMNASTPTNNKQAHCEHQQKANRLRGGGAGKVSGQPSRHQRPLLTSRLVRIAS